MAAAYLQRSSYREAVEPRRKLLSLVLAVAAVALLILLLIRLGAPSAFRPPEGRSLTTFDVGPATEQSAAQSARSAARAAKAPAKAEPRVPPRSPPPPQPPPMPPAPLANPAAPPMLAMNLGDSDIGKMARAPKPGGDADSGKDSAAPYGPGAGPGGATLYEAEWYREPPRNALALYLPGGAPAGAWATIACRTIADYHVDSCRQIGESPPGLGLSRAVREAAWQFLVRPPRLGGKPLVGAWVRIRFNFEGHAVATPGAGPRE